MVTRGFHVLEQLPQEKIAEGIRRLGRAIRAGL